MAHADHSRDPWQASFGISSQGDTKHISSPWVILNEFCAAFAMGAVGGSMWYGIKGARNSPRGERFIGAISSMKARAPVTGGNLGVFGGLLSTFDCAAKGWRQKEDAWNAIISGFMTGSAIVCGVLLGVFEGVGVLVSRAFSDRSQMAPLPASMAPQQPTSSSIPGLQ
ncbi:Tim17/Tim22/Tim23/Pmp24 family-domain-containing protein [Armillaria borealis]|uniref:Tim17/Tim22/Tim23/Pmp24 family-domain-containing protein n=1 Tax=Armillaria borealis TaxID=47425 RepID=A0AA39ML28_9AGAR|nr:Tim17/Tim22/Tim23/Pmp24 family-domain-containing protein [Armillaria borealis]